MKKPFMLQPAGIGLLVLMLVLSADQLSKFWILYGWTCQPWFCQGIAVP